MRLQLLFLAMIWLPLSSCAVLPTLPPALQAASDVMSGISLASSVVTGKGTTEHAMDMLTGQDCRFDALTRSDRHLCEQRGSVATQDDFKGLSGLLAANPSPHGGEIAMDAATVPPLNDTSTFSFATQPTNLAAVPLPPQSRTPQKTYSFLPKY